MDPATTLLQAIRNLEREIADWRTKNSQSNPGAVMELRDMRKQLAAYEAAYITLLSEKPKKDDPKKDDPKN